LSQIATARHVHPFHSHNCSVPDYITACFSTGVWSDAPSPLLHLTPPPLPLPPGHFQADHHPCPHPSCLERKFVVFAEEQDLRRHFATEHGSEMNMSRAQRRQVC
jgi:hypothetical protein